MTIATILRDVNSARNYANAPAMSERQLRRVLVKAGVKPTGQFPQKPRWYPEDSATKVIAALGLTVPTNGHAGSTEDGKIVGLSKLKKTRDAHRRKAA